MDRPEKNGYLSLGGLAEAGAVMGFYGDLNGRHNGVGWRTNSHVEPEFNFGEFTGDLIHLLDEPEEHVAEYWKDGSFALENLDPYGVSTTPSENGGHWPQIGPLARLLEKK